MSRERGADPVVTSYDSVAAAYAEELYDELAGKPLDRHLLARFAEGVRGRGLVADVGCGPGQVASLLHELGTAIIGIDISPEMVREASRRDPDVRFRVGDMRALDLEDGALAGMVAFYAIVHLQTAELPAVFREWRRVLADDGLLLVAFHVGDDVIHRDELFGKPVSLDFRFHRSAEVARTLGEAGFAVAEACEREPYPEVEHPSRRCYLLARTRP